MASGCVEDGFRILLKVFQDGEEQINCFIFLNFNEMKTIRDVEKHVKYLIGLQDVFLFVDGAWLPSNETVHVINQGDVIMARHNSVNGVLNTKRNSGKEEESVPAKRKRKKKEVEYNLIQFENYNTSVDLLYQELNKKKNELLLRDYRPISEEVVTQKRNELLVTDNHQINEEAVSQVNNTLQPADNELILPVVKKKRIRKHKKKLNSKDAIRETDRYPISEPKELNVPFNGIHTRFAEESENKEDERLEQNSCDNTVEIKGSSGLMNNGGGFLRRNETEEMDMINLKDEEALTFTAIEINSDSPAQQKSVSALSANLTSNDGGEKEISVDKGLQGKHEELSIQELDHLTAVNQEQLNENDWKARLLNLAKSNDLESKVFYRKNHTENFVETLSVG